MSHAHIIAGIIGITLSALIYMLVRKDHLSPHVAARWFLVATVVASLGMFPNLVDYVGGVLGVGYPPILAVILAICAALIKILVMDIERQKMQTKLDRLVQKVAILEGSIKEKNYNQTNSKIVDFENEKKNFKSSH